MADGRNGEAVIIHMLSRGKPLCGDAGAKLISVCPTETSCPECIELSMGLDRDKHRQECGLCREGME